jgi:hypothetical protein
MAVIKISRTTLVVNGYELGPFPGFPALVTVVRYIVTVIIAECATSKTLRERRQYQKYFSDGQGNQRTRSQQS